MTELADINLHNEQLLAMNPELGQLTAGRPKKPSKWHNIKHMDPDGEVYGSGKEAEDARKFAQAVRAGEYIAYLHHLQVTLPSGNRMELDHVIINNKFRLEVFDTKGWDERKKGYVTAPGWKNKAKEFKAAYGIEIQLI